MSNRRKAAAPPQGADDVPALSLEHYSAQPVDNPELGPLVSLHLGGLDVATRENRHFDFVMTPEHARAIMGELRRALP